MESRTVGFEEYKLKALLPLTVQKAAAVAEATIWFSRTRSATHGEMTPIRIATETAIHPP